MKQIFLLASLILLSEVLSAQTLSRSDIFFQGGESYTRYHCDSIDPGPSGNGVTWDLSALNSYSSEIQTVTDYSGANYPTASIKVSTPAIDYYYEVSDTLIRWIGGHSLSFISDHSFTNPLDYMRFPITPTWNYSDNYACNYINNVGHSTSEIGSLQREFSGFGTLITPNGTFTDVIRIKSKHILRFVNNTNGTIHRDTIHLYLWYKAGVHHELASVSHGRNSFSGFYSSATYLDVPANLSLEENTETRLSVFPNPTADAVTFHSDELFDRVEIVKLSGEIVSLHSSKDANNQEISLSGLSPGLYLAKVYRRNDLISVKRISKN
ncbi:hypothetical protein D3C87_233370 [compost metagenome]